MAICVFPKNTHINGPPCATTVPFFRTRYQSYAYISLLVTATHWRLRMLLTIRRTASVFFRDSVNDLDTKMAWVPAVSPIGSTCRVVLTCRSIDRMVRPPAPRIALTKLSGTKIPGSTICTLCPSCHASASSRHSPKTTRCKHSAAQSLAAETATAVYRDERCLMTLTLTGHSAANGDCPVPVGAPQPMAAPNAASISGVRQNAAFRSEEVKNQSHARSYISSTAPTIEFSVLVGTHKRRLGRDRVLVNLPMPAHAFTAESVASWLHDNFAGWHESSSTDIGRTLFFAANKTSFLNVQVESIVQKTHAKPIDDIGPLSQNTNLYEPLYVRVKSNHGVSAATVCSVDGYLLKTELLTAAELKVTEAMNRQSLVFSGVGMEFHPKSYVSLYPKGATTKVPQRKQFLKNEDIYDRAISLAADVISSAQPDWRDPRSRAETNLQFQNTIRQLSRMIEMTPF